MREEPQPEPEPVVEERVAPPEPEPEPVVKPPPVVEPPPVDRTQQARERARVAGLLPLTNQLQALRNNVTNEQLQRTDTVGAASSDTPFAERSLITSRVGTASGGINTAALSRNTGGSGLGARETTQVENPVEGFAEAGGAAQRSGASDKASRSREEIERVFDANKGRIFTLYNRALRENPALQGKVVLRLSISPDGRVTHLRNRLLGAQRSRARARPRAARAAVPVRGARRRRVDHDDEADRLLPRLSLLLHSRTCGRV